MLARSSEGRVKLLGACGRSSPTFSLALEIDEEGIAIRYVSCLTIVSVGKIKILLNITTRDVESEFP